MTKDKALTLEALKYAASMGHMLRGKFGPFTIKSTLAQPAQPPLPVPEPSSECNPQDLCAGCRCKYSAQPPLPVQPEQGPLRVDRDKATHDGIVKAFASKELMPGLPMPEPDVIQFGEEYEFDNSGYSEFLLRSMVATAVAIKDAEIAQLQALAQPVQGPVAWGVDWGKVGDIPCVSIIKRLPDGVSEIMAVEYGPSRPWVGLTDEERRVCTQSPFTAENYRAIEQALKEKNCG